MALPYIEAYMRQNNGPYAIWHTEAPFDAISLARQASESGASAVVAVGGDGTIHEVSEGLIGTKTPLGIIPVGSGNDFVASLNHGRKLPKNIEKRIALYLDSILHGQPQAVDMIRMDKFHFLNIGSVGVDAEIAYDAAGLKKALGGGSYVAATCINALTYKACPMRITYSGGPQGDGVADGDFALAAVANGQYYGGGFRIAPSASLSDGYMTLCLINKLSHFKMFSLFPTVLLGMHGRFREVHFIHCRKAMIHFEGVRHVNLDGNIYHLKTPLHFEILPQALDIFRLPVDADK